MEKELYAICEEEKDMRLTKYVLYEKVMSVIAWGTGKPTCATKNHGLTLGTEERLSRVIQMHYMESMEGGKTHLFDFVWNLLINMVHKSRPHMPYVGNISSWTTANRTMDNLTQRMVSMLFIVTRFGNIRKTPKGEDRRRKRFGPAIQEEHILHDRVEALSLALRKVAVGDMMLPTQIVSSSDWDTQYDTKSYLLERTSPRISYIQRKTKIRELSQQTHGNFLGRKLNVIQASSRVQFCCSYKA